MRSIFLLISFFYIISCSAYDSLITVVLMIKDEEKVICQTIEPMLKGGIDTFFIYDTGSTDNTIEIIEKYFIKNNVQKFCIAQEKWIDFAASRNRALDLAKEKFPDSVFLLMPDAEWYLHNTEKLINFCKSKVNATDITAYGIKLISQNINFYASRLIRANSNVRFAGVVHETINASAEKLPTDIYFKYEVCDAGSKKTEARWLRDKELLLKAYNENPEDSRSAFYLAQTFDCLNDYYNAYHYYILRSKLPGWDEENYETFYRLGRIVLELSKIDKNFNWDMARAYYEEAYKMRPHRAEPLFKIAEHYWPNNPPMAYIFATHACVLPYPENEVLFVEKDIYDFWRFELLSKAAWYVGDWKRGEMASRKAIEQNPHLPHLYRNLSLYLEQLQS